MMQQNTAGVWGVPKLRAISSWLIVSEWGLRGLILNAETLAAGFRSALPALQLDSRLRGNDAIARCSRMLPGVWGCPATPQPPPRLGVRGLNPKNEPRKEESWLI